MARIRTVKPDLFVNERVAACSVTAVVTYIGLFSHRAMAQAYAPHRLSRSKVSGGSCSTAVRSSCDSCSASYSATLVRSTAS
ncbi:hypothetical protein [Streptomyces griseoluteus]|nr:hypothetical protein [Streptomyces griseoluteus]